MQVMLPTHLLLLFGLLMLGRQADLFNMPHPIDRFSTMCYLVSIIDRQLNVPKKISSDKPVYSTYPIQRIGFHTVMHMVMNDWAQVKLVTEHDVIMIMTQM